MFKHCDPKCSLAAHDVQLKMNTLGNDQDWQTDKFF